MTTMKFTCEKAILNEAIGKALRAVSSKSTISALEGILFEAKSRLSLTGYDLEIGIRTVCDADIIERGSVILNAQLIASIVRKLPDNIVTISTDEETFYTTISCGSAVFNLLGQDPGTYPEVPTVFGEKSAMIPQNILKSMIQGTIFAVSDNENKPIITGCLFKIIGNTLTVVALDNYRLAIRKENVTRKEGQEDMSFVVPGKTLREVERFLDESDEIVNISLSRRHITYEMKGTVLTSRLLEGEYINYDSAIPKEYTQKFTVKTDEMISSLDRVSLVVSEKLKSSIRCSFSSDLVKLSCTTAIGKAYDECAICMTEGNGLEIGFNSRYLLDALRACKEEEVICTLNTPLTPCLIHPTEGDKFLYMVLPVRIKAGE